MKTPIKILITALLFFVGVNVFAQTDSVTEARKKAPARQTLKLPNGRAAAGPAGPYKPDWESIKANYQVPEWLKDGKFGIFMHFGVYTVPAHGSEWYPHHLYTNQGFTQWHIEHFGTPDKFGYKDFIPMFKCEKFDPDEWADLFAKAGAKYICPTAEHHDGFAMYDSKLTKWNAKNMGPHRDIIGDLSVSVRKKGIKFGISNHRMENWDFLYPTIKMKTDVLDPKYADFYGPPQPPPIRGAKAAAGTQPGVEMVTDPAAPQSQAFLEEWLARNEEIVDKYKPDMVFFDNGVNPRRLDSIKLRFAAYYYNSAAKWGKQVTITTKSDAYLAGTVTDFEREGRAPKQLTDFYWQVDDPIADKFGYVEGMKVVSAASVVRKLIENVSRNGNLMLNISPKSDGTIPDDQRAVLLGIGKWLAVNGDAIYSTRAWTKASDGDYRFTTKGKTLYAIAVKWPEGNQGTIVPFGTAIGKVKKVSMLGHTGDLAFSQDESGLRVTFPTEKPCDIAYSLKIERE
ncbi:alpha-L-fucosidase [Mucilaginibacter sp. HMF5004]|uniref:alpha-L-fucosidase n=1 Tax=Mucilaginibacter rivuli TaxID=2857527 RepID=UPI001C5D6E7E|nr:alpha-L-fucosidase [Mucilaginibacter rivuli]MBW4888422.1 alpha-L-fucosidase [Mucilaginibacter rivuli]